MLKECFKGVTRVFHGCFKSPSRVFYFQMWFREFFKGVTREFQECFKRVSRGFQGCFKEDFFLKVYCCMPLITATRAEGGLVKYKKPFLCNFRGPR